VPHRRQRTEAGENLSKAKRAEGREAWIKALPSMNWTD
jgi:hypothetical protein